MTLQELTDQIRTKATHADSLNATAKIVTDQGVVYIDAKQSPAVAFMSGKLKVKGDMGVAMKMGQVMG